MRPVGVVSWPTWLVLVLGFATAAKWTVIWYAVAVSLTIYMVGCFLARSLWPYGDGVDTRTDADAVVTVLLLVPGFLYTRLDLPGRHTILGRLRALSRQVAHVCIGSAVVVSAAVATGASGALRWTLLLGTLLPIVCSIPLVWRTIRGRDTAPDLLAAPAWLRRPTQNAVAVPADAVFYSSGSDHE